MVNYWICYFISICRGCNFASSKQTFFINPINYHNYERQTAQSRGNARRLHLPLLLVRNLQKLRHGHRLRHLYGYDSLRADRRNSRRRRTAPPHRLPLRAHRHRPRAHPLPPAQTPDIHQKESRRQSPRTRINRTRSRRNTLLRGSLRTHIQYIRNIHNSCHIRPTCPIPYIRNIRNIRYIHLIRYICISLSQAGNPYIPTCPFRKVSHSHGKRGSQAQGYHRTNQA